LSPTFLAASVAILQTCVEMFDADRSPNRKVLYTIWVTLNDGHETAGEEQGARLFFKTMDKMRTQPDFVVPAMKISAGISDGSGTIPLNVDVPAQTFNSNFADAPNFVPHITITPDVGMQAPLDKPDSNLPYLIRLTQKTVVQSFNDADRDLSVRFNGLHHYDGKWSQDIVLVAPCSSDHVVNPFIWAMTYNVKSSLHKLQQEEGLPDVFKPNLHCAENNKNKWRAFSPPSELMHMSMLYSKKEGSLSVEVANAMKYAMKSFGLDDREIKLEPLEKEMGGTTFTGLQAIDVSAEQKLASRPLVAGQVRIIRFDHRHDWEQLGGQVDACQIYEGTRDWIEVWSANIEDIVDKATGTAIVHDSLDWFTTRTHVGDFFNMKSIHEEVDAADRCETPISGGAVDTFFAKIDGVLGMSLADLGISEL